MYGNINKIWIHNWKPLYKSPEAFADECLQMPKEETVPNLNILLYRTNKEDMIFNLFYKDMVTLALKLKKDIKEKKLQTIIPHEHRHKILNKILAN